MPRKTRGQQSAVPLIIAAGVVAGAAVIWAPWYFAFAGSVASAGAWCIWLERHPA